MPEQGILGGHSLTRRPGWPGRVAGQVDTEESGRPVVAPKALLVREIDAAAARVADAVLGSNLGHSINLDLLTGENLTEFEHRILGQVQSV